MNRAPRGGPSTALAVSMTIAAGAQAQTAACDDFKATLAARFESNGVRGFSLEAVRSDAPTPADAKVIGNCEAGAYKILYRRWGAARTAPAKAATPDAPAKPAASVPGERATRALAASAAAPTLRPAAPPADTASASAVSSSAAPPAPAAAASGPSALRPVEAAPAVPSPPAGDRAPPAWPRWARSGFDFAAVHWPWLGALLLLPLAGWDLACLSEPLRQGRIAARSAPVSRRQCLHAREPALHVGVVGESPQLALCPVS